VVAVSAATFGMLESARSGLSVALCARPTAAGVSIG